MMTEFLAELTL